MKFIFRTPNRYSDFLIIRGRIVKIKNKKNVYALGSWMANEHDEWFMVLVKVVLSLIGN